MKKRSGHPRSATSIASPSIPAPTTVPTTTYPTSTSQYTTTSITQTTPIPPASTPSAASSLHGTSLHRHIPSTTPHSHPKSTHKTSTSRTRTSSSYTFTLIHSPSDVRATPTSVSATSNPPPHPQIHSAGLSVGATAGIGVALGATILVLAGIILWLLRRRIIRSSQAEGVPSDEKEATTPQSNAIARRWRRHQIPLESDKEVDTTQATRAELTPTPMQLEWRELGDTSIKLQLQSTPLYEMPGRDDPSPDR